MLVKLFATLKDRAGANAVTLAADGEFTVRELRALIAAQHPSLAELAARSIVAINHEFAFDDDVVRTTDEVALFPPVSGG
jgi:molybdopterin synthase catalytic subunit